MTDREKDFLILYWNLFEKSARLKLDIEGYWRKIGLE